MKPRLSILTLGVRDLGKAIRFYRDGLGWPTEAGDEAPIAFFRMETGTVLALYPLDELAKDISPQVTPPQAGFSGITLAYNVPTQEAVAEELEKAVKAGAKLVKPAQKVFWGGYSGYFQDPEGYFWEVAWGPDFQFGEDGRLLI